MPTATPLAPLTIAPCRYLEDCPGAIGIYDLLTGDVNAGVEYSVDIPYDHPVMFLTGWITTDYTILAQNMKKIQFFLMIDGSDSWDDSYMGIPEAYYYPNDPTFYASQGTGVVLSGWKVGEPHQIRIGFTINEQINDGWNTYSGG